MRGNRKRDTGPELRLRRALWAKGLRFRVNYRVAVPGRPINVDIVFTRLRIAVLVDGCYWHGCPVHGSVPRANAAYWEQKIRGNIDRDRRVDSRLRDEGWTTLRVWEHVPAEQAVSAVIAALAAADVTRLGRAHRP